MANLIPRHFIDELLGRVDIVDIIEPYLPLKKTGANFKACCPFHEEKSPSFTVSPRKQIYHCFGCGVSGNAIGFLMAHQNYGFVEAVEALAQHAGVPVPVRQTDDKPRDPDAPDYYQLLQSASEHYQQQLRSHAQKELAIEYLKQRGLTGNTAKRYAIGYAPAGWDNLLNAFGHQEKTRRALATTGMLISKDNGGFYDRFRQRIMFPIRDHRNRVLGFGGRVLGDDTPKYLNSPETPVFHKGHTVYGLYEALQVQRHWQQIIIVEGYMDVVMLAQHGVNNAVATLGTAITPQHIKLLSRYADQFVFCFDGDTAGKKAAERALEIILSVVIRADQFSFMFLPTGDDPDSFIQRVGATQFKQTVATALPLSKMLFESLSNKIGSQGLEGKTRLIQLAAPMLQTVRDETLRFMLIDELSRIVRVPTERLQTMLHAPHSSNQTTPRRIQPLETSNTPMQRLIALLLQHPELAKTLADPRPLIELQPSGYEILQTLLDLLAAQPELTTGQLLEHWRDDPLYPSLSKLSSWELHLPTSGLIAELNDTRLRIIQHVGAQQIDTLLVKANQQSLSDDEKRHLQDLIKQQKQSLLPQID